MNQDIKQRARHRLKIIEGQIHGLSKAVEADTYCPDLIAQSLSVQESLKSLNVLMLENHIRTHAREQIAAGAIGQVVEELTRLFKLHQK